MNTITRDFGYMPVEFWADRGVQTRALQRFPSVDSFG